MTVFANKSRVTWYFCLCFPCTLILGFTSLQAQTSVQSSPGAMPGFQTKVSEVLVDAVVTDRKGEPVAGLQKKDFEILEDGKPQKITAFEEHRVVVRTKLPTLPPMPPDVYTNFPPPLATDSVNVLLLDSLNTQVVDQSYVRAQLIRYLHGVQPGTRLAVFVLTSRLRMIQSVTTDSAVLLAALNDKSSGGTPQQSTMLLTREELETDAGETAGLMENLVGQTDAALAAMVPRGVGYMMEFKLNQRIEITLQALQQLARYLNGIPGRKNLIWFSGSFPISVFPDSNAADPFERVRQYGAAAQRTATLLTAAQVAIYPIAAEGLVSGAAYETSAAKIGSTRLSSGSPTFPDDTGQNADHLSMELLAEDTGGKAFYDTNGVEEALARAIKYGSHYYRLAYTPANQKRDGRYRRIQLRLSGGDYKVAYRRGYYADNAKDAHKEQPGDPLLPFMQRGLPDFSQILYKLRVAPTNPQPSHEAPHAGDNPDLNGPCTRYGVDFAVAVGDLAFETTTNGLRTANVEEKLIVYDREGKPLNAVTRRDELVLNPQSYAAAQAAGLQLHFEIDVPDDALGKNDVYLQTGIYDLRAGNAGTLEVPLHRVTAATVTAKYVATLTLIDAADLLLSTTPSPS
jgi:VWFA-related protein